MFLIDFMVPFLVVRRCRNKSRFCITYFDKAGLVHFQVVATFFCYALLILDFLILKINAPSGRFLLRNLQRDANCLCSIWNIRFSHNERFAWNKNNALAETYPAASGSFGLAVAGHGYEIQPDIHLSSKARLSAPCCASVNLLRHRQFD
jgi:hypothetical protein